MLDPKVQSAKALLKPIDIDRIICLYLCSENATIDWNKAKVLCGSDTETRKFKYFCKKSLEPFEDAFRNGDGGDLATPPDSPTKTGNGDTVDPAKTVKTAAAKTKITKRGGNRKAKRGKSRVKIESDEESEELSFDDFGD